MPVGEVPVPAVRSGPLGKCLALSSANGLRLNAPGRSAWRDRQERCRRIGLGERIRGWFVKNGGSNRISEVWECHVAVLSLGCWIRCERRPIDCSAESGDGGLGAGGLDAVGLSWMSWDMIEKVRRADQGFRGIMDAGRTERGFHAIRNEESAGQRLFRWVGVNGL